MAMLYLISGLHISAISHVSFKQSLAKLVQCCAHRLQSSSLPRRPPYDPPITCTLYPLSIAESITTPRPPLASMYCQKKLLILLFWVNDKYVLIHILSWLFMSCALGCTVKLTFMFFLWCFPQCFHMLNTLIVMFLRKCGLKPCAAHKLLNYGHHNYIFL